MPVAQSDYLSQLFELACSVAANMLSYIDWSVAFINCVGIDDLLVMFKQKCL